MNLSQFGLEVGVVAAGVFLGLAVWATTKLVITALLQVRQENLEYRANRAKSESEVREEVLI